MKFLLCSLFLFIFDWSFGQKKSVDFFPDTLECIGISNHYQPEDIYSCVSIQVPITRNWLLEVGIGTGWRHVLTRGRSFYGYVGGSFDLMRRPRLFLGPAIRGFHERLNLENNDPQFSYSGGQAGYRFAYGGRFKVVNSSYFGLHNFSFRTGQQFNNKLHLGYAFQIGLNFEI